VPNNLLQACITRIVTRVAVPTDRSGQKHCAIHDVWHGQIEQCGECRKARGITVKTGSPKADTRELHLREAEYREADKYLRRIAREWLDDGTAQQRGIALKAFETATKYARLALEIHTSIKELEHDQWLVEQKRLLGGGGN
jgi:hypothetical protein